MSDERAQQIRLRLSGAPVALLGDGREVPIAPVDAALLVWLALEGPTPRRRIAQLLWPDGDVDAARNVLRQRLFKLRRQFGAEVVVGQSNLMLAAAATHDLPDADNVLGGVALDLGEEFRAWLDLQRARRRERVRDALVELADMAEHARDWPDALSNARELLAMDPLSEHAHRRVMRLHYLAGDRAQALQAFDECERLLKDELGTRPSPETLGLLRTVEQAASVPAPPSASARAPVSVLRPPRLVGRHAQWHALDDAWSSSAVALVSGEGGMGKSRIAGDFAQARGILLVSGARPGDERVAFASFSRLLRALPRATWPALPDSTRRELARVLPELGEAPPPATAQDRTRLFNAAASLFARDAGFVDGVVFDDLHFADDASIELLQYTLSASPQRWLLTTRASEAPPALRRWLDELRDAVDLRAIALQPLSDAEVGELVDSLDIAGLDGQRCAAELARRSGGNPLIVLEIIKAGWQQGDAALLPAAHGLHRLVSGRIARLSTDAVQLARCAALAAPDFSIELAAAVMGRRTIELADPVAELEAAQVLIDGAFVHDLIYEAALASVPPLVARPLHAEIAAFLTARDGEPARLARHWLQARRWPEAGAAFLAAADVARDAARVGDHAALLAEAADCFRRAGDADARFDALMQRATVLCEHMFGVETAASIDEVAALARTPDQRLQVLAVQAEHANLLSDPEASLRFAEQGIEAARAVDREDLLLRFLASASSSLSDLRKAADAVALLEPHAALARRQSSVDLRWLYWHQLAFSLDYAGRLREANSAWAESRAVASGAGRQDLLWQSLSNAAATLSKMGHVQRALELYEQAAQLAQDSNESTSRLDAMRNTWAHRLRDVGRYDEALTHLEDVLPRFREGGLAFESLIAENRLAQLFQQLGQPGRAAQLLASERGDLPPGAMMMRAIHRADVAHDLGRDAVAAMRDALAMIPDADDIYYRIGTLFASRIVPADEGEAMATSLAAWAAARERLGLALAAHVRAAACSLRLGAPSRAVPHVDAALHLVADRHPDSFYLPELWLVAGRTAAALGRDDLASARWLAGRRWIDEVARVPAAFRASFLQRNPVNRELIALTSSDPRHPE